MSDQKPNTSVKLIAVKSFTDQIEAELARGVLASHGIVSSIHAEDVVDAYSFPNSYTRSIQLMIRETDLKRAQGLLKI